MALLMELAGPLRADAPVPAPDFKETYDLIREHLAGLDATQLNQVAVQSLLRALAPKVLLVGEGNPDQSKAGLLVTKASLFDGPVLFVRVGHVGEGLDKAVRELWQQTSATNKLAGLVLDLRFAEGTDYQAAVATADLFVKKEQALLDWGKGMMRSTEKSDNPTIALAILVNQKTAAAAEALAAALRESGAGLILGSRTAGQAMIAQEYPLKNGQRLLIATAPVQLGDGSALSSEGVKPDIAVEVSLADEQAYASDAFREISRSGAAVVPGGTNQLSGTTRIRRPRFNEAELVRERRDGAVPDSDVSEGRGEDSDKPVVRDPVLGRALDFLKGLSVVRQTRS
ncbi:MAG TPA: S41 family peptidase [Patescibacteria group bacterium]|nr:S41 family peptidase [Patescibacteria group bacterium]